MDAPKEKRSVRRDVILILSLAAAGLLIFLAVMLFSGKGETVEVRVNGRVTASYPLGTDRTVMLTGADGGTNLLVIKDGSACIQEADCPDKLCVRNGWISRQGQSVICLPHKLVIEIKGASSAQEDIDVYVK